MRITILCLSLLLMGGCASPSSVAPMPIKSAAIDLSPAPEIAKALFVVPPPSQTVTISWSYSGNAGHFQIQSEPAVTGPWSNVTNVTRTAATNYSVAVMAKPTQSYYRLQYLP